MALMSLWRLVFDPSLALIKCGLQSTVLQNAESSCIPTQDTQYTPLALDPSATETSVLAVYIHKYNYTNCTGKQVTGF
jgi:hypothetical protein